MSVQQVIIDHLDLWTEAVEYKKGGRGSSARIELTGIKKLRELVLTLGFAGLLTNDKPSAWERTTLGDLGKWGSGGTPTKSNKEYYNGEIPWLVIGDLNDGTVTNAASSISKKGLEHSSAKLIPPETLLIAMYGSIGKLGITGMTCATNQAIAFCIPEKEKVELRFLFFFLLSTREKLLGLGQGLAQQNISQKLLKKVELSLPPIEVQRHVVEKLDELMALCDRLEQQVGDQIEAHEVLVDTLLDALTRSADATELAKNWTRVAEHFDTLFTTDASIDKLEQTILQLGVMGRLVEQDARDEPAVELLKRIKLGKDQLWQSVKQRKPKPLPPISESEEPFPLPSGWTLSRLDDITDIQGGIAKGKKTAGKKTRTLPYLRVANVQRSSLDLSEIKEIEIAEEEVERYLVHQRDLLITEGGDWDKVGRTAIWDGRVVPMAHQNHVFRARLILVEQNERWLERYLNSHFARHYFASSSKQTTNLASINKTQLRSCTVPLPPLKEQYRIVKKIDELMALCDKLKERLNQASNTRRNLADAVVEESIT